MPTHCRIILLLTPLAVVVGYLASWLPDVWGMPWQIWVSETIRINSYFTLQSNWLIAGLALLFLLPNTTKPTQAWHAAATIYIAATGLIHFVLLQPTVDYQGWDQVGNIMHHYVTPILGIVLWFIRPERGGLQVRHALYWLAFPLAFLAYWLIRGPIVGYYAYFFIDVEAQGWAGFGAYTLVLCMAFYLMGLSLVIIDKWQGKRLTISTVTS